MKAFALFVFSVPCVSPTAWRYTSTLLFFCLVTVVWMDAFVVTDAPLWFWMFLANAFVVGVRCGVFFYNEILFWNVLSEFCCYWHQVCWCCHCRLISNVFINYFFYQVIPRCWWCFFIHFKWYLTSRRPNMSRCRHFFQPRTSKLLLLLIRWRRCSTPFRCWCVGVDAGVDGVLIPMLGRWCCCWWTGSALDHPGGRRGSVHAERGGGQGREG